MPQSGASHTNLSLSIPISSHHFIVVWPARLLQLILIFLSRNSSVSIEMALQWLDGCWATIRVMMRYPSFTLEGIRTRFRSRHVAWTKK